MTDDMRQLPLSGHVFFGRPLHTCFIVFFLCVCDLRGRQCVRLDSRCV